ncbi:efflux RND transporter periplasmic adaptor subunit [Paracoccus liaowanqingii]|uniref:Efflux RND transporter periplasmic adaptor subunit n=2 Tax=Paracoccus liaowanqingii TaxID=2560053 RepID=A0A4V1BIN9_9RHOB|nr:efflux RND transporter periplasmic adaptor subunit [Paracoccus liaowanqingii]QBX33496.1 efflux RND transporter periplasmic adaptor subunit [Paracoccus liaowanqingii]
MFKLSSAGLCLAVLSALAPGARAQDIPDLRVQIVIARTEPLALDVQLSGQIEAVDTLDLGFRQGGRVTEVLVAEGDRVAAGQALARLNAVQQDQALNVAEAGLAAARAGAEQARQARDRADALLTRGVGTRAAADQAEQALSQAVGAQERAETAVEQARRALDDAVLRAPAEAVVTAKSVTPGQVVAAAQPVIELAALSGLEAVFQAADDPALREIPGRRIRLETLDIDRPDMTGTVTEVSPLVDPETGTVTVRARIETQAQATGLLGASVRGHLQVARDDGVVVPWTALMRQGHGSAVWTVDAEDRVALTPVRIAHFGDGTIYVAEGLAEGQRVVGDGSQLLYPGRRVQAAGVAP